MKRAFIFSASCILLLQLQSAISSAQTPPDWLQRATATVKADIGVRLAPEFQSRLDRGLRQVSQFWREQDGDSATFVAFMETNFADNQEKSDAMFNRYEYLTEQLGGHMVEITRELRTQTDLDNGVIYPFDATFASYDPSAHVADDFFDNKLAFVVLLNFPLTTLEERVSNGGKWTRRQWAEVRLAQGFAYRVPAEVNLAVAAAASKAERYVSSYNIWMDHVVNNEGERLFPRNLRLLSHWNLRDEIKSDYGDHVHGLEKQRTIQRVMEHIINQTIPKVVVDNPAVDWNPFTNEVMTAVDMNSNKSEGKSVNVPAEREPDTRYATLLGTFRASRLVDPFFPTAPTLIARRFDEGREIPEAKVKTMLEQVLSSPLVRRTAALIQKRLGRPLEPFDIWYNGFKPQGVYSQSQLDSLVSAKYPTVQAYKDSIPSNLEKLGFTIERALAIADNIIVDPARGSGHAWGAAMRSAKTHLRTRVEKTGMNYKGYNIAVHEMGHNVEQTFSLNYVDHTLLQGVPNTAFTEAFAFVFQGHDLELLGLKDYLPDAAALKVLDDFWGTYEISGVALVDMAVWHWMYEHPDASPSDLKEATLAIARDAWNKYYAPVLNIKDVELLAIYSHMIDSFLYLPDYPIGHIIAYQIEGQMDKAGSIGSEFERMATYGRVTPDAWMKHATGLEISPDALLAGTANALDMIERGE